MRRGDLVTVSWQGDHGKPRPALVVQTDLLADLESVVLCPVTSDLRNAAFRVTVEPNPANGLHCLSQLTSSPPLACGHRLRGKGGDSYGAQAWH